MTKAKRYDIMLFGTAKAEPLGTPNNGGGCFLHTSEGTLFKSPSEFTEGGDARGLVE